jgi:regulatory protein
VAELDEVRHAAVGLLARREHSRRELLLKLAQRGFSEALAVEAVEQLAAAGLQSDRRYAEAFVASAVAKGQGAMRIGATLRQRGVSDEIIEEQLAACDADWLGELERVRRKRFGAALPKDTKEWARQARFLQYRGFSAEQIRKALKQDD